MFNIVLFNPQIPQNTGNIARTCAVSGASLHLIRPFGFVLSEKAVRRAGLDYWSELKVSEYENFEEFLAENKLVGNNNANVYLITTKGSACYTDFEFHDGDYFVFGSETAGLPESIHARYPDSRLRIPMRPTEHARCLNLANSVGIILYEAQRQIGFAGLI